MQTLFKKKIYLSDQNETVFSIKIEQFDGTVRLTLERSGNFLPNGFLMSSGSIDFRNPADWERRFSDSQEVLPQTIRDEINQQLVRLKGLLVFL